MTNSLATISPQPDILSTEAVVRHWIVIIAELCGRALTLQLVKSWCLLLADVEPKLLHRALEDTARTCSRFFPTPGEVRARIDGANERGFLLEAERAWEEALEWIRRWYHPDLGIDRRAPALAAVVEHSVRAAGGWRFLESCPESELQWCRRRFIEAYTNCHKLDASKHLLSDEQAKKILAQILNASDKPRNALPTAADPNPGTEMPGEATVADFRALRERLRQSKPLVIAASDEELERLKRGQILRLTRHLQDKAQIGQPQASSENHAGDGAATN